MNAEIYKRATPEMKELFNILTCIKHDIDYMRPIIQRLEKELPEDDDNEQR